MSDAIPATKLTLTPTVLIAVAAVLVDASFLADAYQDRIWAQLLLWLAASLQGGGGGTLTMVLVHILFFFSVSSASYQAFVIRCRWWWSTSYADDRADYSRLLAPSTVVPLLYSWLMFPASSMIHCAQLFAVTFLALAAWRWTVLRKRRVRQELVGMPTVESIPVFFQSTRSMEEQSWAIWTPGEVLTWIHGLEGANDWSTVCSLLAPERIPGSVLDTLTVSDLRSMGIPYGPAQCLLDKISDLTDKYPPARRTRRVDVEQDEAEIDKWLGDSSTTTGRIHQVARPVSIEEGLQQQDTGVPISMEAIMPEELNDEAIQHAKSLFREQFGLELPEIGVRSKEEQQVDDDNALFSKDDAPQEQPSPQEMASSTTASGPLAVDDSGMLPDGLLESMPPHVREVAEQRPDLVQMLWQERREGKSATALGLSRIHELRMQDPAYAKRFVGAQAAAEIAGIPAGETNDRGEDDDEEATMDQSSDGERTSLLRKRAAARAKYASIR